ncbi:hypothetical protein [Limosilactobacillus fermentum]|nr:hypothetical protein [Limosilactobacillus fermentum]WCL66449.1 hypothetical protein MWLf4_1299 [Limosilactobacillus fermentum]WEB66359.1 hypothetical protein PUW73_07235 [Limosilactobacillus fermentum]
MKRRLTAIFWLVRTSDNVLLTTGLVAKYGQRTALGRQLFTLS